MDDYDRLALLAGIVAGGYIAATFTALFFMGWSRLIQVVKAVFYVGSAATLIGVVMGVLLAPIGSFLSLLTIQWAELFLAAQSSIWFFALVALGEAVQRARRGEALRANGETSLKARFQEIKEDNTVLRRRLADVQHRQERQSELLLAVYQEILSEPSVRQSLGYLTAQLSVRVEDKLEEVKETIEDTMEEKLNGGETDEREPEQGASSDI